MRKKKDSERWGTLRKPVRSVWLKGLESVVFLYVCITHCSAKSLSNPPVRRLWKQKKVWREGLWKMWHSVSLDWTGLSGRGTEQSRAWHCLAAVAIGSLTILTDFVFSLLVFLCLRFLLENSSLLCCAERNNVLLFMLELESQEQQFLCQGWRKGWNGMESDRGVNRGYRSEGSLKGRPHTHRLPGLANTLLLNLCCVVSWV